MTILYIDLEHDHVRSDSLRGPQHQVKLETARAFLGELAGVPCVVEHFQAVSASQIAQIAPAAIVLSGSTVDWQDYEARSLEAILGLIRDPPVPLLGICAGHQLIGFAHGAAWGPLGPLQADEADPDPRFAPGQRKERGFLPVEIDGRCPLFAGVAHSAAFFQSHYWQLTEVPSQFTVRASSLWSPIQAIEHCERLVFGVQFHPERYTTAYPAGAVVLRNFFALASQHGPQD